MCSSSSSSNKAPVKIKLIKMIYRKTTSPSHTLSSNSLNWLVWSQAHYSIFFLLSRSLVIIMNAYVLFLLFWLSLMLISVILVCVFSSKILIFLLIMLCGCCCCFCCCWRFDEKRHFMQCLTETCNQQLRTTEATSICEAFAMHK